MRLHIKKTIKRVLLTLLIFILSFSAVSMIVTVIFYHTAFPRSDQPSEFSYTYAQAAERGYPCTQLKFPSGDNTLTGYYYAKEDPTALVVIAAGFGDSGASHLSEMMMFADSGFGVFCYDATGVGESGGKSKGGLSQPALDLKAALAYLAENTATSNLPILLYGHSAGGYAAATCLSEPGVRAAVIISAFESPTRLMRESARHYVGFLADIEYPFLCWENNILFGSEANESASGSIEAASVPVAVYEGADDRRVPASQRLSGYLDDGDDDITLTVCDDAPRSGHDGLWLSDSAFRYRKEYQKDIPVDPGAANALDPDFISDVIAFYRASV